MKKLSARSVVAIGIGAALFFVLGRFVAIPSPVPNTNVTLQYAIAAFMATLFGPVVGALVAFIGHMFIDMSYGYGIWWSWVIASGVFGLITGLFTMKIDLQDGIFGGKEMVNFNLAHFVAHLVCWGGVAPLLDILIYNEPLEKLFMQGLIAAIANSVTTAIVGTILCVAYATSRPKKGSLTKE